MEQLQSIQGIEFYISLLIAIVLGIFVLRKIASCLLRSLFFIVIIAVLVYLYFHYFT